VSIDVSEEHIASIFRVKSGGCLPPAFTLVSCLAYFSALKNEAICSSETIDFEVLATCFHAGVLLSLFFDPED
jgi:hypothetical protein